MNLARRSDPFFRVLRRCSLPAALLVGLPLLLALGSCGKARSITAPPKPAGVEPAAIAPAFHALDFTRFVTDVVVYEWSHNGRLDASWTYDPSAGTWRKVSDSYQSVYVGGPTPSELRNQTTVTLVVQFLRGGAIQSDLLTADRARMDLLVRQHRYAVNPNYPLDDGFDVVVSAHTEFGLQGGSPDTLAAAGSLRGWADETSGLLHWRADYEGVMTLRFDFPDAYVNCPAQELAADIHVLSRGSELDRYRGVITAAAGEDRFEGVLRSEYGAGGYGLDLSRGCSAPASTR